ncbi:MAG: hypothetical protein ABEK12_01135, partial [Candidatus Nanohaloarchaea archaeon]
EDRVLPGEIEPGAEEPVDAPDTQNGIEEEAGERPTERMEVRREPGKDSGHGDDGKEKGAHDQGIEDEHEELGGGP